MTTTATSKVAKSTNPKPAERPGFRPFFAGRPRLMLLFTLLLAALAALSMLFVGHAQPNLYQGF